MYRMLDKTYYDIECPYCGAEQDICHDDGYGYVEDEVYEQGCNKCDKSFVYTTCISFSYSVDKADCLNGAEHNFVPMTTWPKEYTKMRCKMCDARRRPTESELAVILEDK